MKEMAETKRERVPDYPEMVKYLTDRFPEVDGKEFYKDIFPDNENAGEHKKIRNFRSLMPYTSTPRRMEECTAESC